MKHYWITYLFILFILSNFPAWGNSSDSANEIESQVTRTSYVSKSNHSIETNRNNPLKVDLISLERIRTDQVMRGVEFLGYREDRQALVRSKQGYALVDLSEIAIEVPDFFPSYIHKDSEVFEKHDRSKTGTVLKIYSNGFIEYRRHWTLVPRIIPIDLVSNLNWQ